MIRSCWEQVGGTLIEEFPIAETTMTSELRRLDAIILPNGENRIAKASEVSLDGQDVIVIQCKAHRLGMYLMGQALFSRDLVLKCHKPRSVRSIALCNADDSLLRPLLESHEGLEVVVQPSDGRS